MNYSHTTQVPNRIFAILDILSEKELKILLIVVRSTHGWLDKNGQRKKRDWLSQKQLSQRCGISKKSVSLGVDQLVRKGLIICTSGNGYILKTAEERKGQIRIYYALSPRLVTNSPPT